jgi:acetolactate synthase regulatory subunit
MSQHMVIRFDRGEGAVIRMLGVIERRGFIVRRIEMVEEAEVDRMTLDVEPRDPSRRLEVLELQLSRLQQVRSVRCSTPA